MNLSAFETFFDEKRPFFLEGASLFSFAQVNAWNMAGFPRRLQFAPHRPAAPAESRGRRAGLQRGAPVSRIPAAVKLTGKTAAGWSVALLDAVTQRGERPISSMTLGAEYTVPLEPLSNYFVGRVRHESADGNAAVGGLVTAVDRRLDDPTSPRMLRSSAYVGGVDFNHYWADQRWALDAFLTGSVVRGDPAAIAAHPAHAGPLLPAARRRALLAGHDPDLARGLQRGRLARPSSRAAGSAASPCRTRARGTRSTTWASRSSPTGGRWRPTSATRRTGRARLFRN